MDFVTERVEAFDIIVIGAGIAGASVAAELADGARILLLEKEDQPGYHTTGRSAALYTKAYGPPVIRALTRASWQFFNNPQSQYIDHPLLQPRGVMFVARSDQMKTLQAMQEELGDTVKPLNAEEAQKLLPLLRPGYIAGAMINNEAADIDVAALHQHFLKTFRTAKGELRNQTEVTAMAHNGERWTLETSKGSFSAPIVVNAAGAWGDTLAQLAGVAPVGLVPKRRTALLVSPPAEVTPDHWPMAVDVDEQFYLKPDAGKLLISPADETPSPPCDAQPEEMDVAICVDRIETAFDISVRHIEHKWAGLRSFVADKCPVCGFDEQVPGFFWLVGQGGYGIQSAPALARVASALIKGHDIP
ncbi:MAG: FAD-binding oxidoreductase, partial [Rhizobiaceae bacterium]|nr:FAD-binding oxidoreductase [Rhizobiaceae bacterium]